MLALILTIVIFKDKNLDWFPYQRCMSLSVEDTENEQNEIRSLQGQLEATNTLVRTLSMQLAELRDQVRFKIDVTFMDGHTCLRRGRGLWF